MKKKVNSRLLLISIGFSLMALLLMACSQNKELITDVNISEANKKDEVRKKKHSIKTKPSKKLAGNKTFASKAAKKIRKRKTNNMSVIRNKRMVTAANPLAVQAGLSILRMGGSAIDAAIATQLALNVVEPQSSGIGGGAFLMHFDAKTRKIEAYDGRETAPASANPKMFLKEDNSKPGFFDVVPGGLSVGVPGTLHMLELAHKKHGKLPWQKLFEPAIRLAEEGFKISPRLNALVKIDRFLKTFKNTEEFFYDSSGFAKPVGTLLINKPFAKTLKIIAEKGASAFYTGQIAQKIVRTVRNSIINPGKMTVADLGSYRAKERKPLCSFYRKWLVCGMPPPTSGGIATLQILGLLQKEDLSKLNPLSFEAVHLLAEASRLAFADRNKYLADDDFVTVPKNILIDPGYLKKRSKLISKAKSMGRAKPGVINQEESKNLASYQSFEGESTTHISIVDQNNNAISMTSSIENAFGSRLMVGGFLLNNQLTDFAFSPQLNGKPIANRVEANKRPRSSMSPMLIVDGNAKLVMAIGSPGGSRIIGYVAKTIIAVLDWKLDIQSAINLPHYVNRNGTTDIEQGTQIVAIKPALEKLGHQVRIRKLTSGLHGIYIDRSGRLNGGADPRREGIAEGD